MLSAQQLAELQQALEQPAVDGGIWSGAKVAQWITHKTGKVSVRAQRGWDYLRRCRFPPQRPRPRHLKADLQAQADNKRELAQPD